MINYINSLIHCSRTNERDASVLRVIITINILVCCLYITLAVSENVSAALPALPKIYNFIPALLSGFVRNTTLLGPLKAAQQIT